MENKPFTRKPDFENNMLKVLKGERPDRATLCDFFFSVRHLEKLSPTPRPDDTELGYLRMTVSAMAYAGYDYANVRASHLRFEEKKTKKQSHSLNEGSVIHDWESFEKHVWPDMKAQDYSILEKIKPYIPDGMKLSVIGPGGVLENAIALVGYDNLCFMLYEEPELVKEVFDNIGSRLVEYYDNSASADSVGMLLANDDWGFNTQTFFSPEMMREYLFPWHKRIVETVHKHGKPIVLHSCGMYNEIIDDVIDDHYDGRHSYEDNIVPVEKAYEDLNGRIAVCGGIDINFLATSSPAEVEKRCRLMLERTWERGGYALGSGNSIADYIPFENYMALLRAANEFKA